MVQYTAAQKAAYYRKLAAGSKPRRRAPRKGVPTRRPYAKRGALSGTGDYKKKYRKLKKSNTRRSGGFDVPDSIGGQIGGWLGHGAQKIIGALTGFGDYNVSDNSLMEGGLNPPQIINSVTKGGIILRHREYLQDITASGTFRLQSFDVNPGLSDSFPWLSNVAASFEEYAMRGICYEFKSMSSDSVLSSSASTALGTVIMATSYNVLNPNFQSKREMENYEFANSSKPSVSFMHPIECKKSLNPVSELFIRTGPVPATGDARLYDLGNFQIAVEGMQNAGTGTIGELWCTYEIELYKPKYNVPETSSADRFVLTNVTDTAPLGSSYIANGNNNIGCTISAGNKVSFPPNLSGGKYFFLWNTAYDVSCSWNSMTVAIAHGGLLSFFQSDLGDDHYMQSDLKSILSTTSPIFICQGFLVQITGPGCTVTFANIGIAPSGGNFTPASDLQIFSYPSNMPQ